MKYKKVFDEAITLNTTVFDFNFTVNKIKEDNTYETKTYSINIPNSYAWQHCGERKLNEWVKRIYKDTTTTPAEKLTSFKQTLTPVIESNKFKWAALLDSMTLYFNPLWNVDGSEITEENRAARLKTENIGQKIDSIQYGATQRTDQHGAQEESIAYGNGSSYSDSVQYGAKEEQINYGNGSSYTDSIQYGNTSKSVVKGSETDSVQYGATQETLQHGQQVENNALGERRGFTEHSTNPFNDAGTLYQTDKETTGQQTVTDTLTKQGFSDVTSQIQHTDQTTLGQRTDSETEQAHTDTTTHGSHIDKKTEQSYTDTTTHGAHTDKKTNATYTDTSSETTHTDTKTNGTQQNTVGDAAFKDTITVTRHGNIGVTKSTDLLESYRQLMVDLYPIILDDIMKSVSRGY